jgi:predicted metal-binding membrane protein
MAVEALLKRDRAIVAASLLVTILLAWLYLAHLASEMAAMHAPDAMSGMESMPGMEGMPGMESAGAALTEPDPRAGVVRFALTAVMWIVMMVGMMLPSAAPTILLFSAVERKQAPAGRPHARTALFVLGYLIVWSAFALLAAAAQMALAAAGLVSPEMSTTSALLGGALFVAAGVYEWSVWKQRCLAHCRSPIEFLARHVRPGDLGALRAGAIHGAYCVGCCWALMLLLFVGGVMNLLWVAALAAIVLAQKLLPRGEWLSRFGGLALVLCGVLIALRPF